MRIRASTQAAYKLAFAASHSAICRNCFEERPRLDTFAMKARMKGKAIP
jgi:hypothetical protein